jgi:hypothetical protein
MQKHVSREEWLWRMRRRRHVRARALERFGLTRKMLALGRIIKQIENGRAVFVKKGWLNVKIFDYPCWSPRHGMTTMRVVYETQKKEIMTVYPAPGVLAHKT